MKWSKPLMMDNDNGIEGCQIYLYSGEPCSPTVIKRYEMCPSPDVYYF
ncbi:MAG: hypothetical protein PVF58_22685 [Candidatus Methanofastidiosia archaeon]